MQLVYRHPTLKPHLTGGNQLAIYKYSRGFELKMTEKNSASGQSGTQTLDCESKVQCGGHSAMLPPNQSLFVLIHVNWILSSERC